MAINLVSIVEVATNFYFLLSYKISLLVNINTYPSVDFLSILSIVKSILEYLVCSARLLLYIILRLTID